MSEENPGFEVQRGWLKFKYEGSWRIINLRHIVQATAVEIAQPTMMPEGMSPQLVLVLVGGEERVVIRCPDPHSLLDAIVSGWSPS